MNKVDKELCLKILERGLRSSGPVVFEEEELRRKEIFRGLAKDWKEFEEKKKEFCENGIFPETRIAIAEKKSGEYYVISI